MKSSHKQNSEFINPYRQNPRCFNKYYDNCNNLNVSLSKGSQKRPGNFLDDVSRASSIKIKQNPFENQEYLQNQMKQEKQDRYYVVSNKRKTQFQNPQIYNLISKHIEVNQTHKKMPQNSIIKNSESQFSSKFNSKSFSIDQFKKIPKITQFSRQTFYRNISSSRGNYSSRKQKQDNLHSKNNLDINSSKISLCKKTLPWRQRHSFVTFEVYILNKRIGVEAAILAGALKQIKFRLIMNQTDSKTFNQCWKANIEQFLETCLSISEDGIGLKIGSFNAHNHSKSKSSRLQQTRKNYLQKYESFIQKQIKPKSKPIKIGNIIFCSGYQSSDKRISKEAKNCEDIFEKFKQQMKASTQDNPLINAKDNKILQNSVSQIHLSQSQSPNRSLKEIVEESGTIHEQSHNFQVKKELKIEQS